MEPVVCGGRDFYHYHVNEYDAPQPETSVTANPVDPPSAVPPPTAVEDSFKSARFLYCSYFFAAWGDRMWEFAAVIFLLEIFPGTLLPSSVFGFAETLVGIIAGPHIGKYIDNNNRLVVIRTSVTVQNTVLCGASILFYFSLSNAGTWSFNTELGIFFVLLGSAMIIKVGSAMNKISIHKDWCVVLAAGRKEVQTSINSNMRRVDLTCAILAPMAVGVLSSAISPARTCLCIAAWSFCSCFVEWNANQWVYRKVPALQAEKRALRKVCDDVPVGDPSALSDQWHIMLSYFHHRAFWASLPYCLLYASVLSFGGIIVSYLRTLGCSDTLLAAGRGAAALVAIGATVAVPPLVKQFGLVKTGLLSNYLQLICLIPLMFAFTFLTAGSADQNRTIVIIVFVSICTSRFGLWAFDLAQTQLMQELVLPKDAGKFNGAQDSLTNFCWLLSFVFTMAFPDPTMFRFPAYMSFGAVAGCTCLFTLYSYRNGLSDEHVKRNPTPV